MSDDERDPFEALDPGEDREGDPFERLGSGPDDADGPTDEHRQPDDGWLDGEPGGPHSGSSPDPDDPFSGMDDRGGDPFGSGENAFERVDVDHIDADRVWAALAEGGDGETAPESSYAEVSKHRYCEQCEHFSAPPNAHCTNEGTEIVEFLDMETVRLLDCPVVAEQHEIEDEQ